NGIVTNTYSGPTQLTPLGLLNATVSNIMLAAGVWSGPRLALTLPVAAKLLIIAAAVAAIVFAVRWLGRNAWYCLLWTLLTLLPTANLSAARWLYIPSFGICLLAALVAWKLWQQRKQSRRQLGYALAGLLMFAWSAAVVYENVAWYRSGE